jgi:hypothetical protein
VKGFEHTRPLLACWFGGKAGIMVTSQCATSVNEHCFCAKLRNWNARESASVQATREIAPTAVVMYKQSGRSLHRVSHCGHMVVLIRHNAGLTHRAAPNCGDNGFTHNRAADLYCSCQWRSIDVARECILECRCVLRAVLILWTYKRNWSHNALVGLQGAS